MSKSRGSPRKFAEKIALLNKKEAEGTSEFEKILKEVKETTRVPNQPQQYWGLPVRSSSFSDWQTYGPLVLPQQQQQQPTQYQPNGSQYLSTSQHVQYPAHPNQIQQARQHVITSMRQQSPQQHNNNNHQQHPGNHSQQQHLGHHPQQQRLQPAIYVSNQHGQPNEYIDTTTKNDQQAHRHQPISIEVPNIEIFPIDDDYHHQQQRQQLVVGQPIMPVSSANDTLSNGHLHNDCSNSSITSARSLPNIANLSVSTSPTGQMNAQPMINQRLNSTFFSDNDHQTSNATTTIVTNTNNYNDGYPQDTSRIDYVANEEYCSLPPTIQQTMHTINRHDQSRQSQTHIPLSDSWQQVPLGGLPSSAAVTPPSSIVQGSSYAGSQQQSPQHQQMVHSPDSSPHRQQPSPQASQDYYSLSLQAHGQLMKANSTNVINKYADNELLDAPRIDSNLSKSTDVRYGYLENFATSDEFCAGLGDGNGCDPPNNNLNNSYMNAVSAPSTISRSRSENNIDHMSSLIDYQFTTNDYVETGQQFLDTPQGRFYE